MENIEWKNGDECAYKHIKGVTYTYIGAHPSGYGHFVYNEEQGITYIHNDYLEKPLSKEEIEKQSRLEVAYDLYLCGWHKGVTGWGNNMSFEQFCVSQELGGDFDYLAIVDKTGYRKGEL